VTVQWHPDALAEADAATEFYRDKRRGIAQRFLDSLEEALHRIELHPHIYRELESGIRKCRIKTFPYAVIFRDGATIEIVAVMHIRRKPGYWKNRT
jgi:plasmid stabilization system protein ParE